MAKSNRNWGRTFISSHHIEEPQWVDGAELESIRQQICEHGFLEIDPARFEFDSEAIAKRVEYEQFQRKLRARRRAEAKERVKNNPIKKLGYRMHRFTITQTLTHPLPSRQFNLIQVRGRMVWMKEIWWVWKRVPGDDLHFYPLRRSKIRMEIIHNRTTDSKH